MATRAYPVFPDVPAWPEKEPEQNPRAVIGGNEPPLEERIAAEFREALLTEKADFMVLLDQLLGKVNPDPEKASDLGSVHRTKCDNDEQFGRCGDLVKRLRICEQLVDAVHATVKRPYWDAGKAVDAEKNAFFGRIGAGKRMVQTLMDDYTAEQLRLKRQQEAEDAAERKRLEDDARANNVEPALPPPPPPTPARTAPIRSNGGSTVSVGIDHIGTVTDYAKAFRKVKDNAKVREAIDVAIQKLVRDAKGKIDLPGVTITERAKTTVR